MNARFRLCLTAFLVVGWFAGIGSRSDAFASSRAATVRLIVRLGPCPAQRLVGTLSGQLGAPVIYRGDPNLIIDLSWRDVSLEEANEDLLKKYQLQLWETKDGSFVLGPANEKPVVVTPRPTPTVTIPHYSNDPELDRNGFMEYGDPGISTSLDTLASSTLRLAWSRVGPRPRTTLTQSPLPDLLSWMSHVLAYHPQKDLIAQRLLDLFRQVEALPISDSATLSDLESARSAQSPTRFPFFIPEPQRYFVTKMDWKRSIANLVIRVSPQAYYEVCAPVLEDQKSSPKTLGLDRTLAAFAVESPGSMPERTLMAYVNYRDHLTERQKEYLLIALGNSQNRRCLEFLQSDQARVNFARHQPSLDLATIQLSYDLAGSEIEKENILRECLKEKPPSNSTMAFAWAAETAERDKRVSLLDLLVFRRNTLTEPCQLATREKFDKAIAVLRSAASE